jgi:hypothetical protein
MGPPIVPERIVREIELLCRELAETRQQSGIQTAALLERIAALEARLTQSQQLPLPLDGRIDGHEPSHVGPMRHKDLKKFVAEVNRVWHELRRDNFRINQDLLALQVGESGRTFRRTLKWHRLVLGLRRFLYAHPELPTPLDLTAMTLEDLEDYARGFEQITGDSVVVRDILPWPALPWDISDLS